MRQGFGIIQAIMMLLLLAGILTIALKYARLGARHTQDSYLREQTELFLQSSIQKALLDISATDRSNSCWSKGYYEYDDGRSRVYKAYIKAKQYYLYRGSDGKCSGVDIKTPESHGYILIFAEVNMTLNDRLKVRLIRWSLQRP